MTEMDTETVILNFWEKKCKVVSEEQERMLNEIQDKISKTVFKNADKDNPISAFKFASWLDTTRLKNFFKTIYKRFSVVEDRLDPRIKFLAAMCMGKYENVSDAYRALIEGENWKILGFSDPPIYELLRELVYERIGIERLQELFNFIIAELVSQAKLMDINIGKRVGHDATDTDSLKHDEEAEYSGYYKHAGYKVDVAHDLDNPTLPLEYKPMGINDDEGQNLESFEDNLRQKGVRVEEEKVDGKYASYKNIAISETKGIRLIYKIQEGWKYNEKGTEENVKRVYQKYRYDEEFKVNPTMSYILKFLCERGEYEVVGAYHRNKRMEYVQNHPEEAKKETGERSNKTEGFFSLTKGTTILDSRPRKRGWREFVRRCGISMLAHAFAALIRIQHGIKTALGCVTYIT